MVAGGCQSVVMVANATVAIAGHGLRAVANRSQRLPRVANGWQRLPTAADDCQRLIIDWRGIARNCARTPQNVAGSTENAPGTTRKLPRSAPDAPQRSPRRCQRSPTVANGCQRLPTATKICKNFFNFSSVGVKLHQIAPERLRTQQGAPRTHQGPPRSSPEAPQTLPGGPPEIPRLGVSQMNQKEKPLGLGYYDICAIRAWIPACGRGWLSATKYPVQPQPADILM